MTSASFRRQFRNWLGAVGLLGLLFNTFGCGKTGGGQGAGSTGDYVSGTPLPERREGTSFFGGNGAIRENLIADGVEASRIQTVSFGLEMPADSGHNESAWAKNRRAEIGVVNR